VQMVHQWYAPPLDKGQLCAKKCSENGGGCPLDKGVPWTRGGRMSFFLIAPKKIQKIQSEIIKRWSAGLLFLNKKYENSIDTNGTKNTNFVYFIFPIAKKKTFHIKQLHYNFEVVTTQGLRNFG
jgi:hypothetical protein